MKHKLLIALACAAALCWLCGAALGESKTEYGQQIGASLDALQNALASQDKSAANSALTQVRSSVYAAARYLAQIGEYDDRAMEIIVNANNAYAAAFDGDGNYASYMSQAREYNTQVFFTEGQDPGPDPDTGLPFIKHVHRSSELEIIEPATCFSEGLASGICDAGVNWYGVVVSEGVYHGYAKPAPCGAYFECWTEIDPNNHAGGTSAQGQNIVCLGCGAVLSSSTSYTVSIDTDIANGTVALSSESTQFVENATVILAVSPNTGYELDSLTYTPANGSAVNIAADANSNYSFAMPAANVTVSAAFRQIVYTVTLDPGEGTGGPITYSSANGIPAESRQTVGNCQFYYEDDGSLAFRLEDDYCPGTFTAPADHAFDGWEGNGGYNKLSAAQTTFTARWKLLPAGYSLSPTDYTLTGGGYTDIDCTLTSLVLGRIGDTQAVSIGFYMNGGTLSDGNGHSIPFLVDDRLHSGSGSRKDTGNEYSSQGETFIMAVYIDPDAYSQAVPGTYTGTFTYDSYWNEDITGEPGAIALTLVVPEHVYAIKTDSAALAYYYNDRYEQVFPTEAAEGTALSLMLSDSAEPKEPTHYFTGEFWYVATGTEDDPVSLGSITADGWTSPVTDFTMPAYDVTIGAVLAERETLALTFAPGETRALPMDAWMQLQYYETAEGEPPLIRYDEATGTEALDVNRDGKPDLQIAFDDAAYCVNLTRLPACAAFGEFAFAFSGPTDRYGTIAFTIPAPAFSTPDFTLPAALTTVEEEAFEGIAASVVDVPESCVSIGDRAFKDCPNLTQIHIPANCVLSADVFDGCTMVYVFGAAGSSAEAYCSTHANCVFVENSQD